MKYFVWLNECMGAGNPRSVKAVEHFGGPDKIYNATPAKRSASGQFSKSDLEKMSKTPLSIAEKIINDCRENRIDIITLFDKGYPQNLSVIENPPLVLYVKGKLPDFDLLPSITVVGPRKVSDFGKKAAYSLSFRLARAGFIVVSGGALGCDTCAHAGTLKADGIGVLVMGCGILANYLQENKKLREKVAEKGCLVSEYSPFTPAKKFNFPLRNRIMSALTLGTVVIEAAEKSGSLITARLANEQGRDVFVIPGSPQKSEYKGSNALLRDGAKAVLDLSDIFNEYIPRFPDKINIERAYSMPLADNNKGKNDSGKVFKKNLNEGLSKNAQIVYNHIDKLKFFPEEILDTGLTPQQLLAALTELEMEFYIKALPGGMYELCR
ncbi:MAG: DNA-processing protein DprA [Acutalibacteraceae bacterium]